MSFCRLNKETPELLATFEAREAVMCALSDVRKLVKEQIGYNPSDPLGMNDRREFSFAYQWHNVDKAIELAINLADSVARICD